MSKIRIKVLIKNNIIDIEKEYNAIYNDEKITYKEASNIKMQYDTKTNTVERKTDELDLKYPFNFNKKTHGEIYIKELHKTLDIPIKTTYLKHTDNLIEVKYKIEDEEHIFKIEILK